MRCVRVCVSIDRSIYIFNSNQVYAFCVISETFGGSIQICLPTQRMNWNEPIIYSLRFIAVKCEWHIDSMQRWAIAFNKTNCSRCNFSSSEFCRVAGNCIEMIRLHFYWLTDRNETILILSNWVWWWFAVKPVFSFIQGLQFFCLLRNDVVSGRRAAILPWSLLLFKINLNSPLPITFKLKINHREFQPK